ncbi:pyridoxamine 5'-phosphate oxidase [Nocardia flavorosea]|uniref:Pyridoxamine 5'-phosphate oxidase n=2 Tax=Nocardia flavorosea TaxID=53429 RepID=A0A846YDW1_9NOCA|nr:pyridoxamine 5'-phosphate oxidase [Nocardia flavorosea]
MTRAEREAFLADLHVGVIAIERPARAPLAVPIWYAYEPGGELLIWIETGSVKARCIRDAGRFSLTAQDEHPPYRYVTVEGEVSSIEPASAEIALLIAVRYLGKEAGAEYVEQNLTAETVVVRMRPQRWLSLDPSRQ